MNLKVLQLSVIIILIFHFSVFLMSQLFGTFWHSLVVRPIIYTVSMNYCYYWKNSSKFYFLRLFLFNLFDSNRKYFMSFLDTLVHLYMCVINCIQDIRPSISWHVLAALSTVTVAFALVIWCCKAVLSWSLVQ